MPDAAGNLCPEEVCVFTRPYWRWRWAMRICRGKEPHHDLIDGEVDRILPLVWAIRHGLDADVPSEDWPEYQALLDARAIWRAGGPPRWELEARLLAGQSDEEIASRFGIEPGTVGKYERLFFEVRQRLTAPGWIIHEAIGPIERRRRPPFNLGAVWKLAAYAGGPIALEAILAASASQHRPDWPFLGTADEPPLIRSCRRWIACHLAPEPARPGHWIELAAAVRLRERRAQQRDRAARTPECGAPAIAPRRRVKTQHAAQA